MFKKCPSCGNTWNTRDEFLKDENLTLVGYQKIMGLYGGGYLLFKHGIKTCGTTLAVKAAFFSDGTSTTQRFNRIIKKKAGSNEPA